MANAGGAWDNAKKIVEVDLKMKGTPLHAATVVGDTVGDPFKDTSSVAMNPIIKFTTLFGLLAVEIAVDLKTRPLKTGIGIVFSSSRSSLFIARFTACGFRWTNDREITGWERLQAASGQRRGLPFASNKTRKSPSKISDWRPCP